ncbi:transferase hexapeptide repeat containing protein, partial [Pontibacter sp. BAB1700]
EEKLILKDLIEIALIRSEKCFSRSRNKYYSKNGETYFNPFHSGQYTIFLYYLSNSIYLTGDNRTLADRIYFLNKTLNSCDLFYEISLPEIFMLDHPVGSVMGRAEYGNYFSFSQGCTVGNNKGIFPKIGENVKMLAYSKILGNCNVGNNVVVAANTFIKDTDIPDNALVFGASPNLLFKENKMLYGKNLLA